MCTIFGGDIADDVYFIHGNLPVGFLLAETQCPALLSVAGVSLNTQEHRALETQDGLLKHGLWLKVPGFRSTQVRCRKGHHAKLTLHMKFSIRFSTACSSIQNSNCDQFKFSPWATLFLNTLRQHNLLLNSPSI